MPKVDQGGPSKAVEFIYVDISSVDNKLKRITESKTLAVEAAPRSLRGRRLTARTAMHLSLLGLTLWAPTGLAGLGKLGMCCGA